MNKKIRIVKIHQEEEVDLKRDMYIPVAMAETLGIEKSRMTVYHLTKEYEITKQGLRRWKKENGRVNAFYYPASTGKTSLSPAFSINSFANSTLSASTNEFPISIPLAL